MRVMLFPFFIFLLLTGCSGPDVLNATISRDGYAVQHDVAYGNNPSQKMDIYTPTHLARPAPVIVFFHGGSWQYGSKDDYLFIGQAFASRGFVTAIVNYRLYPEVYFPGFVEDGAQAFRFVHDHIAQYGGDQQRLFLAGHSAGAHIAMMLTVDDHYLKAARAKKSWIRGVIGISGPYDFLPLTDPKLIALFSKTKLAQTQPINFIHSKQPPMFLAHGTNDSIVNIKNTKNVAARLKALHSPVETHYYDSSHIGIVLSLAQHFQDETTLLDDIAKFICG